MKLGSQTGSVINHLHSRAVIGQPEPKPGMGATVLGWTDRTAATIFRVFQVGKATIIETRDDHTTCVSGSAHDGSATYEHKVNVKGRTRHFRSKPGEMWNEARLNKDTGRWIKSGRAGLRIGERDTYYDPSFNPPPPCPSATPQAPRSPPRTRAATSAYQPPRPSLTGSTR